MLALLLLALISYYFEPERRAGAAETVDADHLSLDAALLVRAKAHQNNRCLELVPAVDACAAC